jgi:hypothetical protein
MKSDQLQACYAHWYKRQEDGEHPFLFKQVDPADIRIAGRKRKQHENNDKHGDSGEEEDIYEQPPSAESETVSK